MLRVQNTGERTEAPVVEHKGRGAQLPTEPRRAPSLRQYQNPPPEIDRPKGPVGAHP